MYRHGTTDSLQGDSHQPVTPIVLLGNWNNLKRWIPHEPNYTFQWGSSRSEAFPPFHLLPRHKCPKDMMQIHTKPALLLVGVGPIHIRCKMRSLLLHFDCRIYQASTASRL
jgi:hypothetical protein